MTQLLPNSDINFLIFSLFLLTSTFAQESKEPLISGEFKELSIEQFAERIEQLIPYKLYFDKKDFDSVRINFSVQNQPLSKVLEMALTSAAGARFSIDTRNNIFFIS